MPKKPKHHQPSEAPGSTELNNLDEIVRLPPSPKGEPTNPSKKKEQQKQQEQQERKDRYHE